jgi:hypothetical protein
MVQLTGEPCKMPLLAHVRTAGVVSSTENDFDRKYMLEGTFRGQNGRAFRLRAVWFVNTGETVPRLVTAYAVPGARK